jgi:tripartite-type tricarboxylate transporter receptor subunit TctC
MKKLKFIFKLWCFFGLTVLFQAKVAVAQEQLKYPDQSIRLIVPFAAGGGVDTAARLVAKQMQGKMGVNVLVDNRPGGNGTVGGKMVQTAQADGYTLLFSAATHILAKEVMSSVPYDPIADFSPVARVGEAPLLMVISPKFKGKKLSEVIMAAKARPEEWNVAIPAMGAPSHLATLLMAKKSNLNFSLVPYKGTAPALIDVAGGHSQILLDSIISLMPMAKTGKVHPVVVTSIKRNPLAPDIPTADESGLPGFQFNSWYGIWAPKGTPNDRVQYLNTVANESVNELMKSGVFAENGIEGVNESVAQFIRYINLELTSSHDLLKGAGFKPE